MKALVTGATGFVGGHLAETLVGAGYEIKVLARPSSNLAVLRNLDVEIVRGDITDVAAVEQAVRGCRHVYHLAGKTSQGRLSRKQYYMVNEKGTDNVARASMKANVERLVYCSSGGVYGMIQSPPADENTKPNPNSLYRESKLLGEEVVRAYHKKDGLPVVIARITGAFGPRSLSNWLPLIQTIASKHFRLIGDGENHCHLGYISDVVDGMRRCGEVPGIEGKSYIITGKEPITVKQLVTMIAQELGIRDPPGSLPAGPFRVFNDIGQRVYRLWGIEIPHSHRYEFFLADAIYDISKAQNELGYAPNVSVREGIQRSVRWYREMGYL
jgi:nucleoside-diphosphate-sugar epimerase